MDNSIIVQVEAIRSATSNFSTTDIVDALRLSTTNIRNHNVDVNYLTSYFLNISNLKDQIRSVSISIESSDFIDSINQITISQSNGSSSGSRPIYNFYVYELNENEEEEEFMDSDDEGNESAASHNFILPSSAFHGLWESLHYDTSIKKRLMDYVRTALLFSEKKVDSTLVSWNKVILLHGPPGSGKTSLCKALAQKATILLGTKFSYGQLIEINSHSLFSKWFSESGKLVMKMFEKIHELISDPRALIFLLIDEVESLAKCRMAAEAGNEPADSVRAVNALLTQIDRIKRYPNVMILTTSNIVGSIDLAFVDRADLKIFIGPPPPNIIYKIYASSINELLRVGIISDFSRLPSEFNDLNDSKIALKLYQISMKSENMSGRTLRKIPFLTHVNHVKNSSSTLSEFLNYMEMAVETEIEEARVLKNIQN